MNFKNQNVLITGGASGIGRIMGELALCKGASTLIIWDINEKSIEATKTQLGVLGRVEGYVVDVANVEAVESNYAKIKEDCGRVDILIQCAGVVLSNNTFEHNTISEIDRTMKINAIAPMYVAHAILPDMIERNHGHVCNIASAAGMLSNPKMSIYAASKWAVLGWSDSVRIELFRAGSKVRFTTVAPYYINTGMFDGVTSKIFPILDPVRTSRKIIRAIERDKDFRGIPFGFHFIRFWQAVLPVRIFDWFFGDVFGIYHAMDHFVGRKK
ncbi:MAG: SDR family oxidoreductase [Bacteroidaceae bacterium]|nr:SDR family oxidoreductase [Bacteroidales bacterium]MCF0187126.1 SDR family oxidoreductase [Bacteroidaceae bacterium]